MKQPHISILLPVYNAEHYLYEAIESVLNQTYRDFELLVVDDGSTDRSRYIASEFMDNRVRIISMPHNFIGSLNIGMKESIGKYIARMDADDIMTPDRLQTQLEFMETHLEVDICGSWAECFGTMSGIIHTPTEHQKIITSLLFSNQMIHPSIIIRRNRMMKSKLLYKDYPCAEDYKLWTDMAIDGCRFANIPRVLLHYRCSESQVTVVQKKMMQESTTCIQLEYVEKIMSMIAEKDKRYWELMNQLIELTNKELISDTSLFHTIYSIYGDFLFNHCKEPKE